jgi:hypothetical protein
LAKLTTIIGQDLNTGVNGGVGWIILQMFTRAFMEMKEKDWEQGPCTTSRVFEQTIFTGRLYYSSSFDGKHLPRRSPECCKNSSLQIYRNNIIQSITY